MLWYGHETHRKFRIDESSGRQTTSNKHRITVYIMTVRYAATLLTSDLSDRNGTNLSSVACHIKDEVFSPHSRLGHLSFPRWWRLLMKIQVSKVKQHKSVPSQHTKPCVACFQRWQHCINNVLYKASSQGYKQRTTACVLWVSRTIKKGQWEHTDLQ
jgi:hypothetical protein